MSFSASANVEGDTSGPVGGAVPNAGGAPGGISADFCDLFRQPAAAPSKASDECVKNFLRDFDISPPNRIVDAVPNSNCSQFALDFELKNSGVAGNVIGEWLALSYGEG